MMRRTVWIACIAIAVVLAVVNAAVGVGVGTPRLPRPAGRLRREPGPLRGPSADGKPGTANCTVHTFLQQVDHFSWTTPPLGNGTYGQRYFVYDKYWRPHAPGVHGPIFFYAGNEAPVTLYVNASGLMWENGEQFGALLVWAEHRYWGESMPFGDKTMDHMQYLTHEQALADYATFIYSLKEQLNCQESPVIAFGGSYGGMLAAWLRLKYPGAVAGALAASAPIFAFQGDTPAYDTNSYWQVVTRDATPAGGAAANCASNVRKGFAAIFSVGSTAAGRQKLRDIFHICDPVQNDFDVFRVALLTEFSFDNYAMGDYPFPSNYLTGGGPMLPAWPMRAACNKIAGTYGNDDDLLAALNAASAVYNNASGVEKCYPLPTDIEEDGIWDYIWCTEMIPQETYFTTDGVRDMFWDHPYNATFISERCAANYGVQPRPDWIFNEYGGYEGVSQGSNIIFSNGLLDPWSSGGTNHSLSFSLPAVLIEDGAHHLDLMFSTDQDPPSVTHARLIEMQYVQLFIDEHYARQ